MKEISMRILVTGTEGNVGSQLVKVLSESHDVTATTVQDLDITNFGLVKTFVTHLKPELIINPAAYTDVDGCARNPEKAILVNGYGAQNLAIAAYENNAAIMQISSNEVFDGKSSHPYYEYDAMNPINPYGYSKYVGEKAVRESNPRHYIVRLSWLFAHGGRNFLQAILGAVQTGKSLRVVVDEVANPSYNNDFCKAVAQLVETERFGVYHLCNAGTVSRYQFARYILDKAGFSDTSIEKISRHEWPRPSKPPLYSGMANIAAKSLGITLRDWREAVDDFLQKEALITGEQVGD
jgi:dTDP-4-dehydrorhamnose reductase